MGTRCYKFNISMGVSKLLQFRKYDKILDYISSGKPILNICKIPTCPTLPLMERYPMGLTIYEYEELTDNKLQQIESFCIKNKGKQIPFETIAEIYYDSTISYVGQKFYEVIQSVINR